MISKQQRGPGAQVKVTFTLPTADSDGQVSVVGDFNDWDPYAAPLRAGKTKHSTSLTLPSGRRYAFRYLDGHGNWFNDADADDLIPNSYGGQDGVIDLTATPGATNS